MTDQSSASLQEFMQALSAFPALLTNEDNAELLEDCQRRLDDALEAVQGRLAKIESKRKHEVAARTIEQLKAAGFSPEQIEAVRKSLSVGSSDKPKSPKSPDRYRNPESPHETWSGRGAEPAWIKRYRTSKDGKGKRTYSDEVINPEWQALQKAK